MPCPSGRTLPKAHLEPIVDNIRAYNIHALLVIGGFEVRGCLGLRGSALRAALGWACGVLALS